MAGLLAGAILFTTATAQQQGQFVGTLTPGVNLTLYTGGPVDRLEQAAPNAVSFFVTVDGELIGYVAGAPGFVNAGFLGHFTSGIPANTPMLVLAGSGAPAPNPTPTATPTPQAGLLYPLDAPYSVSRDFDGHAAVGAQLGIDHPAPPGAKVYAPVSGEVDATGVVDSAIGCGIAGGLVAFITLRTEEDVRVALYHVDLIGRAVGSPVEQGELVATVGDSVNDPCSTGPHLHVTYGPGGYPEDHGDLYFIDPSRFFE